MNTTNGDARPVLDLSMTALLDKESSPHKAAAAVAAIQAEADTPAASHHHRGGDGAGSIIFAEAHHAPSSPPASFTALLAQLVPPGGIRSSIFNLAGASIGAGILGLPAASNDAGMLLSFLLLLVITVFSVYSMYLLAVAAENTHIHSFEQMGKIVPILDVFRSAKKKRTAGDTDALQGGGDHKFDFSHVVAGIRFFHSYAGCVAYVISVNDCLSAILRPPSSSSGAATSHYKVYALGGTITIWLLCMLPLVLPKHIDSLRYASTVAVCFMVYFVLVVVVHSCAHGLRENLPHVKWVGAHTRDTDDHTDTDTTNWVYLFRSGNPVIQSVGVFTFAYCCQINAFEVFWDLDHKIKKKRNHRNYTWAAFYAMLLCFVLYCGVIFFCYLDFGSRSLENASILLLYAPLQEGRFYYILIAYVGVLVKLCVAYALLTSAARNSLYCLLGYQDKYHPTAGGGGGDEGAGAVGVDLQSSFDRKLQPQQTHHHHAGKEDTYIDHIPAALHRKVVLILSVCTLVSGLCIPHINVVFGFAGSLSGSCIAFIFPALFYYYSFDYYNYYKPNRSSSSAQRQQQQQQQLYGLRRENVAEVEGVRKLVYSGSIEDLEVQMQQQQQQYGGTRGREGESGEQEVRYPANNMDNDNHNMNVSTGSSSGCDTSEEENEETILSGPPPSVPPPQNAAAAAAAEEKDTTSTAGPSSVVTFGSAVKKKIPFVHLVGMLVLLVCGWIAMVWGTAGTIYNTVLGI